MSNSIISRTTFAIFMCSAIYSLPAAAINCPMGEEARGTPPQCVKRDDAKPQVDVEKYSGAQKAEAQACNKTNAAHAAVLQAGDEIGRLNTSINAAQHEVQDAPKGPAKDAASAKVAELKVKRQVEEGKLKQAQADERAGKQEHRKALKQAQKDKVDSINCL